MTIKKLKIKVTQKAPQEQVQEIRPQLVKKDLVELKVGKIVREFSSRYESKTGIRFSRGDLIITERKIKRMLNDYSSEQLLTALESFFTDSYADKCGYPFPLFAKCCKSYIDKARPTINKINLRTLILKHWHDPNTGEQYDNIKDPEDEEEAKIRVRMETRNYGTIGDLSLDDIERFLGKQVVKYGKPAVRHSWVEAYFDRLKIYSDPDILKIEENVAKDKSKRKKSLLDQIKEMKYTYQKLLDFKHFYFNNEQATGLFQEKHFEPNLVKQINACTELKELDEVIYNYRTKIGDYKQLFRLQFE